jgi:hypothetical protein
MATGHHSTGNPAKEPRSGPIKVYSGVFCFGAKSMDEITMRVNLEIYQAQRGQLRLSEEVSLNKPVDLSQAAQILTKFSDLAKAVRDGKDVSLLIK